MNFFVKSNMVIQTEVSFVKKGMDIKLPFYIHIKDVNNGILEDSLDNELENYGKSTYFQNRINEMEREYKYFLSFVDLSNLPFQDVECSDIEFIKQGENYFLKNVDGLYALLTNYLGFNENDFQQIKLLVRTKQVDLVKAFRSMVDKELEVGSNKKEPNDTFMVLRCAYELNHSAVFKENLGKSISEYSYREICIQRSYMARKCEIERIQLEDSLKKSKK